MNFLTELNAKTEKVFNEFIAAKRASKKAASATEAAYHKGRAEELEKWWGDLEEMIKKVIERKEGQK